MSSQGIGSAVLRVGALRCWGLAFRVFGLKIGFWGLGFRVLGFRGLK